MKRLELPRDEMALRNDLAPFVYDKTLTTVFRPGNRMYPAWRGYKQGEIISLRIIEKLGDDSLFIPPTFTDYSAWIYISSIEVLPISSLTEADFKGNPLIQSQEDLQRHLEEIYTRPLETYDNMVTKITFNYLHDTHDVCLISASVDTTHTLI